MQIVLTDEQYEQLKKDRWIEIKAPDNKGIRLYVEYSETMDLDYFESYHTNLPAKNRRDYALGSEDLEKLRPKKPDDPSWYHNKPLCPNCGTYMIYNFEHCPKCGQEIEWSGFTGER